MIVADAQTSCCNGRGVDPAVAGVQAAGTELSDFFDRLQQADQAARLVRAIRCRNKRLVESLIGPDCQVVCFFNQGRFACVRISCSFNSCCDVRIQFDICVSNGFCRR